MYKKELETMIKDKELFVKLLPLFEKMSNKGKGATVETLSMLLFESMIKEDIRKC